MSQILNRYINHSGGAYGVDTMGCIIGISLGFKNHIHFRPPMNQTMSRRLRILMIKPKVLSMEEITFARGEVNRLLNKNYRNDTSGDLQARNFYQVNCSEAVFCISRKTGDSSVAGGTNTALQLAIALGKDAYVFDVQSLKWFVYNDEVGSLCEFEGVPELPYHYAIVGTRDVEDYHYKDPKTKQWGSRPTYLGKDVEEAVDKAIGDLYTQAKNSWGYL